MSALVLIEKMNRTHPQLLPRLFAAVSYRTEIIDMVLDVCLPMCRAQQLRSHSLDLMLQGKEWFASV